MHPCSVRQRGFSLIELMVAVVIGLALTLTLATITINFESNKRALNSANNLSMSGAYVSYELDRQLRSAGSGFTANWDDTFGCLLSVARNGTTLLPSPAAFPAPFAAIPTQVRLAPVLIHAGAGAGGSDVLALMIGAAGLGEVSNDVLQATAAADRLNATNTLGLNGGDLALVVDDTLGACMLQQVSAGFVGGATSLLTFGGTYAAANISGLALAALGVTTPPAKVLALGNAAGSRPQFHLLGVGNNATLFSYDLLRLDGGTTPIPVADGVLDMRALYGVDTDGDLVINTWVPPTAAGFTAAALSGNGAAAQQNLRSILAVRIGLILRGDGLSRTDVSPSEVILFPTLPALQYKRTLTAAEKLQQVRIIEMTVPLRNNRATQ